MTGCHPRVSRVKLPAIERELPPPQLTRARPPFDAAGVEDFDRAKGIVEGTIRKLGIDPAGSTARTGDKLHSWTFQRGSAAILVNLTQRKEDDKLYLRVVSP